MPGGNACLRLRQGCTVCRHVPSRYVPKGSRGISPGQRYAERMDIELQTAYRLLVALAIGLLIGLERGWKGREAEEGAREIGLRTLGLVGLIGGVSGLL